MEAAISSSNIPHDNIFTQTPSSPLLKDLMEDGIYLLFILRSGTGPQNSDEFNMRIDAFLEQFERNARNFHKDLEDIQDCKYAFCALMDEIILNSQFEIRPTWELNPLQLRIFGEHLAGDRFFDRLDNLRQAPSIHAEALEVFYTCLLLGFQGRYILEGEDKLGNLITRIGQELWTIKGTKPSFAPSWKPSFQFGAFVRHELPLWLFYVILALVAILVFLGFSYALRPQSDSLKKISMTCFQTDKILITC